MITSSRGWRLAIRRPRSKSIFSIEEVRLNASRQSPSIAAGRGSSVRAVWEHVFGFARRVYDWEAICAYYDSGATERQCQDRFGFSNGAWHRAVERGDLTPRPSASPRRKPRGETRRAVERLVSEGMSQAKIAATLGVSRPTVCFHMRQLGIPARWELGRRYDWAEIRVHYEAGHSAKRCQERFGFGREAWADAVRRGVIEAQQAATSSDQWRTLHLRPPPAPPNPCTAPSSARRPRAARRGSPARSRGRARGRRSGRRSGSSRGGGR